MKNVIVLKFHLQFCFIVINHLPHIIQTSWLVCFCCLLFCFFYYKGFFCNSLLFKCMLPAMGADHEAPVMNAFLRGLLTLTNFLQAIQNPNDFTHQERAWNSVCPLVIKLKKFYCFSLRLGTDSWRRQKASPCSRRGNLGHFIDIILFEIRLETLCPIFSSIYVNLQVSTLVYSLRFKFKVLVRCISFLFHLNSRT